MADEEGRLSFVAGMDDSDFENGAKRILARMDDIMREVKKTGMSVDDLAKSVKSGGERAASALRSTTQATHGLGRAFDGLKSKVAGALTIASIVAFGKKVIEVRSEMESLQKTFESLAGEHVGQQLYEDIKQFAATTQMMMGDLAKGAQTLLGFNIEAEKVMPILREIGDISMGDAQKFNSLTLAFAQMSSTGKLMGQDLLQMINAGFNPLVVIAEKTGKSVAALKEEMAKGAISVEMVEDAFRSATGEGGKFHGMLESQSKAMKGALSNLQGAIEDMLNEIGEKSEGILSGSIETAALLAKNYETVGKVIAGLIGTYGAYKAAVMTATAVQAIQTAGVGALTAAETVHYGWLVVCEKAQALLNKTMLNNPYVMAGMAVIGLTAAIYKATTATNAFDDAQERLDDQTRTNEASVLEEMNKLDSLNRKLLECEKGSDAYKNAKQAIINQYGQYYSGLDAEIEKVGNLSGVYDQLTEAIRRSIGARNLQSFYDKEMKNYGDTVEKKLNTAYNVLEKKYGKTEGNRLYHELFKKVNNNSYKISSKDREKLGNATFWDVRWGKNASDGLVDFRSGVGRLVDDIIDAKKASDDALNKYKDMWEITEEQWNEVLFGKNTESQTTPVITTPPKKTGKNDHTDEDNAKERQKLFEQQRADEERIAKERQEMEDAIEDARIAKISNNAEREREERRVQHERNLRQIQEQADKFKQEAYKRAEEEFNIKNKDKKKVFSDTEVGKAGWQAMSLDENQQAIIDAQLEQKNAEYQRYIDERYRNELQATNDFLKEYGNYEQKKLAITQDYEQKIAQASSPVEKASLSIQRDKELKELEKSELEQKIDWSGVFSDLSGHTEEYLTGLRDQLQEILKTGDLPVDQMATIQEKIREIDDEVKKQGGMFKFQSDLQREHTRRLKEAKDAQERLNKAKGDEVKKSMDVFSATQKIKDLMESIGEGDTDFDTEGFLSLFEEGTPEYEQAEEALRVYLEAQGMLTDSQKEAKDAAAEAAEAQDAANERLDQAVARHLANVNEWIQTYLGDLPGLLSELGLGGVGEKVSKGMSAVGNAAGAAADFASGNYVGAALKAVSAIKDFGSVLGIGGGNAAEINKQLEKLSRRNEILTKSIDRLTEAMSNKGGAGAIREYEKLAELQKELEANLLKQMQLQMDYHSAHHSFDYYWGGFSQSEIDEFNKRNGTNWSGDLNDLTADLAAMLQADADMWQKILDTGKGGYGERVADWIEQLAEQAGKATEQMDALYASLTAGTTRESVFDDFLSQMYDLANGSEEVMDNIAKNWQEMVNKMVINNIIGEDMREKLSGWYTDLAELNKSYTDGLIDEEEYLAALERLKNAYTDYVNEGQQQIKQFTEMGIIQPIKDAADEVESIFGNLHDIILDDLTDLEMTGEKMARKLNEAITKQLIEKLIFNDEFNQWLENWENRYNEAVSGESPDQTAIDQLLDEMAAKFDEATDKAQSLRDRLKEIEETVEDTTFKDMGDAWMNTLMDMNKTAEDWSKDIGRTMAQKIIEQFIMTSTLQPLLDRLQKAFNTAMGAEGATWQSVLADDAVNAALSEIETAYPTMQAIVRDIMDRLGISVENNPFADLRSTFVSSLMDLEADAESFGKDIARTLIEQMMDEILKKNGFQEQIEALGEEWQAALEAGDTEAIERIRKKLIELREQAGEAVKPLLDDLDALKDKVETPFDNLRDSMLSALMDMENGMEDFAKNLNNIITQAFIDKFVLGDAFDAKLEEWKSQYAAIMGDTDMDEETRAQQLRQLQEVIGEYSEQMKGEAQAIHDLMGTGQYAADQQATMNMSDKATYEQMDQYLGTQMGIYMVSEQQLSVQQQILATLQTMGGIASPGSNVGNEINGKLTFTNEYLLAIRNSSNAILTLLTSRLNSIDSRLNKVL